MDHRPQMYNKSLEETVTSDTSGHFRRVLVSLLQANRSEAKEFSREAAIRDAESLLAAGEKKQGTDESKFVEVIMSNSYPHLRAVFEEYEKMSKNTMEEALKKEMSGHLLRAFLTIGKCTRLLVMLTAVRCIQNKPAYFAKTLERSMKGLGTDDASLQRVVITRCEIDMVQIKIAFEKEYGKSLGEWIKDDTSGDFRRILLVLIGDEELSKK
ncbi:Annexin A6 [Cichlidogyrus casuarinus]|uniref:Annexin n=1 Tax=Cichlidogyrus casuarinus TaxID=1844966 RepID=A0ABD2QCX3_9PLAT